MSDPRLEAARAVFGAVKRLFRYSSDRELFGVPDKWVDRSEWVLAGKVFEGDCDDFALTCARLLLEYKPVARGDIRLVFCQTETGEYHVIVVVAERWALDNRQRHVYRLDVLRGYRLIQYMQLDQLGVWFDLPRDGDDG